MKISKIYLKPFFKWIQTCAWNKPSVLILDNIDKLMSVEMENMDATKSNQLTEFFHI